MIYVVWAKGTDLVKIGFTEDRVINKRLSALQIGCPFPLEVIAFTEGARHVEHRLHWDLRKWSVRGEWFKWSPDLHRAVQILKDTPRKTPLAGKRAKHPHRRLGAALSVEYRKSTGNDPDGLTGPPEAARALQPDQSLT